MRQVFEVKQTDQGKNCLFVSSEPFGEGFGATYKPEEVFGQAQSLYEGHSCSQIEGFELLKGFDEYEEEDKEHIYGYELQGLQVNDGILYLHLKDPEGLDDSDVESSDALKYNIIAVVKSPEGGSYADEGKLLEEKRIYDHCPPGWLNEHKRIEDKRIRFAHLAQLTIDKILKIMMESPPYFISEQSLAQQRSKLSQAPKSMGRNNKRKRVKSSANKRLLRPKSGALVQRNEALVQRYEALEQRYEALEQRNAELEQRNAELEQSYKVFARRNSELETKNEKLQRQLQQQLQGTQKYRFRDVSLEWLHGKLFQVRNTTAKYSGQQAASTTALAPDSFRVLMAVLGGAMGMRGSCSLEEIYNKLSGPTANYRNLDLATKLQDALRLTPQLIRIFVHYLLNVLTQQQAPLPQNYIGNLVKYLGNDYSYDMLENYQELNPLLKAICFFGILQLEDFSGIARAVLMQTKKLLSQATKPQDALMLEKFEAVLMSPGTIKSLLDRLRSSNVLRGDQKVPTACLFDSFVARIYGSGENGPRGWLNAGRFTPREIEIRDQGGPICTREAAKIVGNGPFFKKYRELFVMDGQPLALHPVQRSVKNTREFRFPIWACAAPAASASSSTASVPEIGLEDILSEHQNVSREEVKYYVEGYKELVRWYYAQQDSEGSSSAAAGSSSAASGSEAGTLIDSIGVLISLADTPYISQNNAILKAVLSAQMQELKYCEPALDSILINITKNGNVTTEDLRSINTIIFYRIRRLCSAMLKALQDPCMAFAPAEQYTQKRDAILKVSTDLGVPVPFESSSLSFGTISPAAVAPPVAVAPVLHTAAPVSHPATPSAAVAPVSHPATPSAAVAPVSHPATPSAAVAPVSHPAAPPAAVAPGSCRELSAASLLELSAVPRVNNGLQATEGMATFIV